MTTIRGVSRSGLSLILCFAVTVGAELAVWMIRDRLIASAEETEIDAVRVEAGAKALALREALSRTLDQIAALQSIAGLVTKARQSGDAAMEQAARNELGVRRGIMTSNVTAIVGLTADLHLDWSNGDPTRLPAWFGDRAYLRPIAAATATETVGDPLLGAASRLLVIPFAKGVYDPAGVLAGVTIVTVEAETFHGLAATMGVTGWDKLTIIRRDGKVMARSDGEGVGETIPHDNMLLRAVLENDQSLTRAISPIDRVERINASERLAIPDCRWRLAWTCRPGWAA